MRVWRWLLAGVALLGAVPLALLAFGVTLDASPWRAAIAERASAALGRPIVIEGPLEARLGRRAVLRVGGLRIPNPPGFTEPDFATLSEASAQVDLLALFSGRLEVRGLEGTGARVRLERAADGRVNWVFARPDAGETSSAPLRSVAIDIDRIALRDLTVDFHDAGSGTRRSGLVEELTASGGWSEPVAIVARGRAPHTLPFVVTLEGGPANLLMGTGTRWPFSLDIESVGARLHAAGDAVASARTAAFEFGFGTASLDEVERFLGTRLPEFGVAALSGHALVAPDRVELSALHGILGESELTGTLTVALGPRRTRATGALEVAALDLRPFLRTNASDTRRPLTYDDLADNGTPLRGLVPFDAGLTLRVHRLAGVQPEVRDVTLQLTSDERGARAPVAATIADVPFAGTAEIDTTGTTPLFAIRLGAGGAQLGDLALRLAGLEGIDGGLERVDLRAGGRGETIGAVVRNLDARLGLERARLSYGNFSGGRPVGFTLDTLVLEALHGQRLRGSARGMLLGKPVALTLRGRELARILRDGALPVELDIAARGVTARVDGVATDPGTGRPAGFSFRVDAPRSGDLAQWLGVARESALPVALRGEVRFPEDGWHVRGTRVKLGRSELAADIRRATIGGRPVLVATVASPFLDVPELATLIPRAAAPANERRGKSLDVPILPQGIDLADADLGVRLDRVSLGRTDATDVRFDARIRDGRLPPSAFGASLAGVPFTGDVALDLRDDVPEASLAMSASRVNVGALLGSLGLAADIEAHAETLDIRFAGRGSRLDELIARASFEARIGGGDLAVHGPVSSVVARMRVREGVVSAAPGGPVEMLLDGSVDATPVVVRAKGGTLDDLVRGSTRVPLSVEARAADAVLRLAGDARLPLGRGGQLTLDLAGERLDSLSALAGVALPRWGPWSVSGPIQQTASGYRLEHLAMQVGESRLTGSATLDLAGPRPELDLRVRASRIQLDDLPLAPKPDAPPPAPFTVETLRGSASGAATQTERILSAAFLRRFDAEVDVAVDEVLSGTDRLGDGTLRTQLLDGQLHVSLAEVNLPGGTARMSGTYDPVREGVALVVRAHVERFDYGILARRRWPGTDVEGLLSLNLELTSTARSLNAVLPSANGRVDVAVWPKNLGARQVDLWVINLFRRLLPVIDRGAPSVFNCAVGRFDIAGGALTEDIFVIDTSRTRVSGTGRLDFATERIDFRFSPRTKRLQLLSLETPVRVTGTLNDFSVGVFPGDVLAAITRFFGSVIVVPLQTLFGGGIPIDGQDVCADPLRLVDPAGR